MIEEGQDIVEKVKRMNMKDITLIGANIVGKGWSRHNC